MLETRPLLANVRLDMNEFRRALLALREQGWMPALLHAEHEFLRLAGVDEGLPLRSEKKIPLSSPLPGQHPGFGELFFRGEDLYYCVCMSGNRRMVSQPGAGDAAAVEVGLISTNAADADKRVKTFAGAFEMAVRKASPKAHEMTFDWTPPKPDRSRLTALEKPQKESGGVRFAPPHMDRALVKGAQVLAERLTRGILAELAVAGFVRTRDILAHRQPDAEAVHADLDKLRRGGLIVREQLLECKKYGTPLTRLSEPAQLETAAVGSLVCPSCGLQFSEEALSEGYSVSDLGQRLNQNSHWLTVLTMYRLFELGVPPESMMWNVSQPGEGVDVAVQFLGQFWTFEVKDGEFGAQDVLAFNYRRARYSPDRACIVTTQKVSGGAKRLLDELSGGDPPVFLEGVESVAETLARQVYAAALNYACERLRIIEELTGYDVGGVVAARFEDREPARKPVARPRKEPEPPLAAQTAEDLAARLQQRAISQKK